MSDIQSCTSTGSVISVISFRFTIILSSSHTLNAALVNLMVPALGHGPESHIQSTSENRLLLLLKWDLQSFMMEGEVGFFPILFCFLEVKNRGFGNTNSIVSCFPLFLIPFCLIDRKGNTSHSREGREEERREILALRDGMSPCGGQEGNKRIKQPYQGC